jgi:hypothetical protein
MSKLKVTRQESVNSEYFPVRLFFSDKCINVQINNQNGLFLNLTKNLIRCEPVKLEKQLYVHVKML